MPPKKISNTWQHIWLSGVAASIASPIVLHVAEKQPITGAIIATLVWLVITLAWEFWQWASAGFPKLYRWLDTIVDLLTGNVTFNVIVWVWILGYVEKMG